MVGIKAIQRGCNVGVVALHLKDDMEGFVMTPAMMKVALRKIRRDTCQYKGRKTDSTQRNGKKNRKEAK